MIVMTSVCNETLRMLPIHKFLHMFLINNLPYLNIQHNHKDCLIKRMSFKWYKMFTALIKQTFLADFANLVNEHLTFSRLTFVPSDSFIAFTFVYILFKLIDTTLPLLTFVQSDSFIAFTFVYTI